MMQKHHWWQIGLVVIAALSLTAASAGPSVDLGSLLTYSGIVSIVGIISVAGTLYLNRRGQNVQHEDATASNAIRLGQTAYDRLNAVEQQMSHVMNTNAAQQTQITELFSAYLTMRDRFERIVAYFRLRPQLLEASDELRGLLFSPLPSVSFSPGGLSPPIVAESAHAFSSSGAFDSFSSSSPDSAPLPADPARHTDPAVSTTERGPETTTPTKTSTKKIPRTTTKKIPATKTRPPAPANRPRALTGRQRRRAKQTQRAKTAHRMPS